MSNSVFLGKVGITFAGDYNPASTYEINTCVYHDGNTYVTLADGVSGVAPSESSPSWQLVARKGDMGEVSIGSTVTLEPSQLATVSNVGTSTNAILQFSIPKGQKGDTGQISIGSTMTVPYYESASVLNTGTSTNAILQFRIPRGEKGDNFSLDATGLYANRPDVSSVNAGYSYLVIDSSSEYNQYMFTKLPSGNWSDPIEFRGAKGEKGDRGQQGIQGETGEQGGYYKPSVDSSGNLTWTNDYGYPSISSVNIRGPVGSKGEKGDAGDAATVAIGRTYEVDATSNAIVSNVGDSHNAVFDFYIPKGEKGEKGDVGALVTSVVAQESLENNGVNVVTMHLNDGTSHSFNVRNGAQGKAGTVTIGTVFAGNTAKVSNVGSPQNAVLDFVLPKGDKGNRGDAGVGITSIVQTASSVEDNGINTIAIRTTNGSSYNAYVRNGGKGDKGDAATVAVGTVTTVEADVSAAVSNVGTATDAIFNFRIPRGVKGDSGVSISSIRQIASSMENGGVNTMEIALTDGTSSVFNVMNGVGIQSVSQVVEANNDGGVNSAVVTMTNGTSSIIKIKNGTRGMVGATNSISIGSVVTGGIGEAASATMRGTAPNQILDLVVPRGDTYSPYTESGVLKWKKNGVVDSSVGVTDFKALGANVVYANTAPANPYDGLVWIKPNSSNASSVSADMKPFHVRRSSTQPSSPQDGDVWIVIE